MPNSITNRQMFFMLVLVLTSVSVIIMPKTMALSAGRGAWVTLLLTALIFSVLAAVIVKLGKMFGGKVLFDYSREIAGRFVSYMLAVFYVFYFLLVIVYLCTDFSTLVNHDFLTKTPEWATLLVGIPVYGLLAYKGVTNLARLIEIIGFLFLIVAVVLHATMLIEGKLNNILPLFNPSKAAQYVLSVKDALIAFLGIEVLTIVPFTAENKKAPKKAFFSVIFIGIFYILVVESCYAMIGFNSIVYYNDPLIVAIRLVQYPTVEFLQRVDIAYMTLGFVTVFAAKAIVYLAIVEYACRLMPKVRRGVVVVGGGVIIFVFSNIIQSIPNASESLTAIISIAGIIAAFIIPLILFTIAKVKKHAAKGR